MESARDSHSSFSHSTLEKEMESARDSHSSFQINLFIYSIITKSVVLTCCYLLFHLNLVSPYFIAEGLFTSMGRVFLSLIDFGDVPLTGRLFKLILLPLEETIAGLCLTSIYNP